MEIDNENVMDIDNNQNTNDYIYKDSCPYFTAEILQKYTDKHPVKVGKNKNEFPSHCLKYEYNKEQFQDRKNKLEDELGEDCLYKINELGNRKVVHKYYSKENNKNFDMLKSKGKEGRTIIDAIMYEIYNKDNKLDVESYSNTKNTNIFPNSEINSYFLQDENGNLYNNERLLYIYNIILDNYVYDVNNEYKEINDLSFEQFKYICYFGLVENFTINNNEEKRSYCTILSIEEEKVLDLFSHINYYCNYFNKTNNREQYNAEKFLKLYQIFDKYPQTILPILLWLDTFHDFQSVYKRGKKAEQLYTYFLSFNSNKKKDEIEKQKNKYKQYSFGYYYRDLFFNNKKLIPDLNNTVLKDLQNIKDIIQNDLYEISEVALSSSTYEKDFFCSYLAYYFFRNKQNDIINISINNDSKLKNINNDLKSVLWKKITNDDGLNEWTVDYSLFQENFLDENLKVFIPAALLDANRKNVSDKAMDYKNDENFEVYVGKLYKYEYNPGSCRLNVYSDDNSFEAIQSCNTMRELLETDDINDIKNNDYFYTESNEYFTKLYKDIKLKNIQVTIDNKIYDYEPRLKKFDGIIFSNKTQGPSVLELFTIILNYFVSTKNDINIKNEDKLKFIENILNLKRIGDLGQITQAKQLKIPLFTNDRVQSIISIAVCCSTIFSIDKYLLWYDNSYDGFKCIQSNNYIKRFYNNNIDNSYNYYKNIVSQNWGTISGNSSTKNNYISKYKNISYEKNKIEKQKEENKIEQKNKYSQNIIILTEEEKIKQNEKEIELKVQEELNKLKNNIKIINEILFLILKFYDLKLEINVDLKLDQINNYQNVKNIGNIISEKDPTIFTNARDLREFKSDNSNDFSSFIIKKVNLYLKNKNNNEYPLIIDENGKQKLLIPFLELVDIEQNKISYSYDFEEDDYKNRKKIAIEKCINLVNELRNKELLNLFNKEIQYENNILMTDINIEKIDNKEINEIYSSQEKCDEEDIDCQLKNEIKNTINKSKKKRINCTGRHKRKIFKKYDSDSESEEVFRDENINNNIINYFSDMSISGSEVNSDQELKSNKKSKLVKNNPIITISTRSNNLMTTYTEEDKKNFLKTLFDLSKKDSIKEARKEYEKYSFSYGLIQDYANLEYNLKNCNTLEEFIESFKPNKNCPLKSEKNENMSYTLFPPLQYNKYIRDRIGIKKVKAKLNKRLPHRSAKQSKNIKKHRKYH
jgi:hypothetical protein